MMVRKVLAFGLVSAITALANAQIVTNLEQGGKLYWKFNSGRYDITGALTLNGNISASDPIEFPLQDLNNDGRNWMSNCACKTCSPISGSTTP
jgi:hypothetical protein